MEFGNFKYKVIVMMANNLEIYGRRVVGMKQMLPMAIRAVLMLACSVLFFFAASAYAEKATRNSSNNESLWLNAQGAFDADASVLGIGKEYRNGSRASAVMHLSHFSVNADESNEAHTKGTTLYKLSRWGIRGHTTIQKKINPIFGIDLGYQTLRSERLNESVSSFGMGFDLGFKLLNGIFSLDIYTNARFKYLSLHWSAEEIIVFVNHLSLAVRPVEIIQLSLDYRSVSSLLESGDGSNRHDSGYYGVVIRMPI